MITLIGIELEEPSQCLTTTMIVKYIYSFVVGKKLAFRQNILTLQPPPAIYACSDSNYSVHYSLVLHCQHIPCADPFWAATYHVANFSDDE